MSPESLTEICPCVAKGAIFSSSSLSITYTLKLYSCLENIVAASLTAQTKCKYSLIDHYYLYRFNKLAITVQVFLCH